MNWKKFPLWLKIESIFLIVLIIFLVALAFLSSGEDLNTPSILFLMLAPIGIILTLWIVSYSIFNKSWKYFFQSIGILAILLLVLFLFFYGWALLFYNT